MKYTFLPALFSCLIFSSSLFAQSQIRSYMRMPEGVRFQLNKGLMQVDILMYDVVRVRYTILDSFAPIKSLVVAGSLPALPFKLTEKSDKIVIAADRLTLMVDRKTAAIRYADATGNEILAEDGRGWRQIHEFCNGGGRSHLQLPHPLPLAGGGGAFRVGLSSIGFRVHRL